LIFAWGLVDPDSSNDITYHRNRRGSRVIPLQSYSQPPPQAKLAGLDTIEFRANNVNSYLIESLITFMTFLVYSTPKWNDILL
jgi:hypothetical protein